MGRVGTIGIAVFALIVVEFPAVASAVQEVAVARKFSGKVSALPSSGTAPESGWLDNAEDWKTLWQSLRPNQPIVEVDFDSQLVLVETVPGPNLVFASILKLSDQGDLNYEIAGSRVVGPGFGYLVMVIPKSGIQSINGKSLDGTTVVGNSEKPDGNPVTSTPVSSNPNPPIQPEPAGRPGIDPTTADREYVVVEIVGRVRTEFQSVGGDTTGTLVAADGIVWELDLQNDPQLMDAASQLGSSLARISGQLKMERSRGSLDGRVRWIVQVQQFEPLNRQGSPPMAKLPPDQPVSSPPDTRPLSENSQNQPAQADVAADPVMSDPQNESRTPVTPPAENPGPPPSFNKLSIVTSDGQTQTIHSDGLVQYEFPDRDISNEWFVDAATIAKLHQFVAETAWERVPKVTRSKSNDPDEIGYTISIETPRSVTRIFIDRSAVVEQATIQRFFGIVSEMAQKR